MIEAHGAVVAIEDGNSIIRFAYPRCIGCTKQCNRSKHNLVRYKKPMKVGTAVILKLPTYALSLAIFLTLGVPILTSCFSYLCTGSFVWASITFGLTILVVNVLYRYFGIGEYLLRPTICRII